MQDEIIDVIHQLSTTEAGIYSSLFGFDGFEVDKTIVVNWSFNNTDNLKQTMRIFMDYLIATILDNYDIRLKDDLNNQVLYLDTVYDNPFVNGDGFDMNQVLKISDLENTIDDIQVTEISGFVCIKLSVPIYKIQFD